MAGHWGRTKRQRIEMGLGFWWSAVTLPHCSGEREVGWALGWGQNGQSSHQLIVNFIWPECRVNKNMGRGENIRSEI
jgi:hypothetical protein